MEEASLRLELAARCVAWARAQGAHWHASLSLEENAFGVAVVASRALAEGCVLVSVPLALALNSQQARLDADVAAVVGDELAAGSVQPTVSIENSTFGGV